jgi:hypothetical protein
VPRVPYIEKAAAAPDVQKLYESFESQFGMGVPNVSRRRPSSVVTARRREADRTRCAGRSPVTAVDCEASNLPFDISPSFGTKMIRVE